MKIRTGESDTRDERIAKLSAIKRDQLCIAADVLDKVQSILELTKHPELFNLAFWRRNAKGSYLASIDPCGTVACAIGHLAHYGVADLTLVLVDPDSYQQYQPVLHSDLEKITFKGGVAKEGTPELLDVIGIAFGIPTYESHPDPAYCIEYYSGDAMIGEMDLLDPAEYFFLPRYYPESPRPNARMVANRILNYVGTIEKMLCQLFSCHPSDLDAAIVAWKERRSS